MCVCVSVNPISLVRSSKSRLEVIDPSPIKPRQPGSHNTASIVLRESSFQPAADQPASGCLGTLLTAVIILTDGYI